MSNLIELESQLRLVSFVTIFAVMAIWELKYPYRQLRISRIKRWPHQLGLILLNTLAIRLFFPIAAVGTAQTMQQEGVGLMNWLDLSPLLAGVIGFVLLDFVIYWQHVIAHRLDWFWKLHRTHHADTDYDLTTGLRFHPLEIMLSMLIKMVVIVALGVPAEAVILFEIVLSGSAMFNHSNIKLADWLEVPIRKVIVTPSMHRIHHSTLRIEHDSNYGFFLSVWDRWFGSYTEKALENDKTMLIGLKIFRERENSRLDRILSIPFKQK